LERLIAIAVFLSDYLLTDFAASMITAATLAGCEINTTWLPFISVTFVMERLYMFR